MVFKVGGIPWNKGLTKETSVGVKSISETRKGIAPWNKGKTGVYSEEHRRKLREANRRRVITKETRRKLSEKQKGKRGKDNPNWKGGKIKRNCLVCGCEMSVKRNWIKRGVGKFCSRRCSGIWQVKHIPKKDTSIEIAMEKELIKRGMPYLKQCPIEGVALVDFLLPNKIVVQCDGIFWHSMEDHKKRDTNQDFVLGFKGYTVFRFTGTEIRKSVSKCVDKVIKGVG